MCSVITKYEVRYNYITNGGKDFTVALICTIKMVKYDKNTLKFLYREDGTYYYPIISDNRLWKKRELY